MAGEALKTVASVVSVAMLGVVCVAPANALSDTTADGAATAPATSAFRTQPAADSSDTALESADAMPENPHAALPDKVSAKIADDATVVSEQYAITGDGELKDIESGETVTDPKIVGTESMQPDPLAKTDGESFIPVSAADVKEKVAANGGDAEAGAGDAAPSSYTRVANGTTSATAARVTPAALQNNEYGAYWGSYNGTPAFFESNGNLFAQQAKGVIDVSTWQGTIDWQAAKNAGVEGAIIRLSYGWGNGFDAQARRNINECKRLGIPFGVYVFSYAENASDGASEGADVVSLLRQAGVAPGDLSYPVFYDLERWSYTGHVSPTSPAVYEGMVNAWYGQLQSAGYTNLSVYSYTSYLDSALNSASIHAKTRWVAQYGARMQYTAFPTNDRGWQYTSSGRINGINGNVDLNAFGYRTYQAAIDVRNQTAISIPNGTYYINSTKRNAAGVTMTGGGTSNGVTTELRGYAKSKAQQFTFTKQSDGSYVITNVNSGKVLDVLNADAKPSAVVQQYDANGSTAQKWFIRDSGTGWYLQSALGNWVLDIAGGNTANGTAIALYGPNDSDAQKFTLASVSASDAVPAGATVRIRSAKNTAYVMDMPGASTANATKVQLYPWNGTDAQLYRFKEIGNGVYEIVNANSGKPLEVAGGAGGNGAAIQQYAGNGTAAQRWSVLESGGKLTFLNAKTAKAMDVPGGSVTAQARLQTYTFNGTAAQQWAIDRQQTLRERLDALATANRGVIADGTYKIASAKKSSAVLDVSGGSTANAANVQLYASNDTDAQRWTVSHDAKGYVTLTNAGSGKVLDVSGGSTSNGANVQQYAGNGTWAQKWIAVKNSGGSVTLRSAAAEGMVIDVSGGSTANGANVQLYAGNGTAAQKWVVK